MRRLVRGEGWLGVAYQEGVPRGRKPGEAACERGGWCWDGCWRGIPAAILVSRTLLIEIMSPACRCE